VGGLVAFLPERMVPYSGLPQAGALHPFFVVSLVPETRNVVLAGSLPARIAATLRNRERVDRAPRFQVVTSTQQAAARDAQRAALLEAEVVSAGVGREAQPGRAEGREAQPGRAEEGQRRAAAEAERGGRRAKGVPSKEGPARVISSRARRGVESGTDGAKA